MYDDPTSAYSSYHFPELDDPNFWADVARTSGVPPEINTGEMVRDSWQTRPPPLLYPPATIVTPIEQPFYQTRLPVPLSYDRQLIVTPPPVRASVPQSLQSRRSSLTWIVLFCLVVVIPLILQVKPTGNQTFVPQSRALVRIDQWNASQYTSSAEVSKWGPSSCSATSMTEVINFYSQKQYRIIDILAEEIRLGEITPELGMLHGASSIQRTVASFGFKATQLSSASIDGVIATASGGRPVIIDFPPEMWPGGHILVVRGGNESSVSLVDSSQFNMQTMTRSRFASLWRGFAVEVSPA